MDQLLLGELERRHPIIREAGQEEWLRDARELRCSPRGEMAHLKQFHSDGKADRGSKCLRRRIEREQNLVRYGERDLTHLATAIAVLRYVRKYANTRTAPQSGGAVE